MKSVLLVINNLNIGGAEKALVDLLNHLDYVQYQVDLLLFKQTGAFINDLPKEVNLLPVPVNYKYFDAPFSESIKTLNPFLIWNRYRFSHAMSKGNNPSEAEQLAWPYLCKVLPVLKKEYDVAIGYLEKSPNYFVVDNVNAKKKIGYIHNDYVKLGLRKDIDSPYFEKLDVICTISDQCLDTLKSEFPEFEKKITLVPNFVSIDLLKKKSQAVIDEEFWDNAAISIVSVGRLEEQKGFNISVEVAKILLERKLNFKWYVIGEGSKRNELESLITRYNLNDFFILTGIQLNPIKFMNAASVIVQTSIFEGKSIVIDEAKLLCKPILVTDYPTARDQIINGINGLIVGFNPEVIASQIIELLNNTKLQEEFQAQLKQDASSTCIALEAFNKLLR